MTGMHDRPYGVGVAYRSQLHDAILKHGREIDLLEIPTEDYIVRRRRIEADRSLAMLHEVLHRFPCVAHGISMSLGSMQPAPDSSLSETKHFMSHCGMSVFSEHLAFHRSDGLDTTMFLSMPFDEAAVEQVAANYTDAAGRLGRHFALENVSYYFPIPDNELSEAEFLSRVLDATGTTLLLDVTNAFNNAMNHGFDGGEFIRSLPGHRVSQLHIAGGHFTDGMWYDSHSAPLMDEVWELLEIALQHTSARFIILERDSGFEDLREVMDDVVRARELFYRYRSENPESPHSGSEPYRKKSLPQPDGVRRAALESFQRALVRRICDPGFRAAWEKNPNVACDQLDVPAEWRDRLLRCDQKQITQLAEKYLRIAADEREEENRYRQLEWALWGGPASGASPPPGR